MVEFATPRTYLAVTLLLVLLGPLSGIVFATATSKSFSNAHWQNSSSTATQWASYTGKDEEFTVLLPERPSGHSKLRPKLASEQRPPSGTDYELGRIYGAFADGIVYVIMSFNMKGTGEKLEDFVKEYGKYHRPETQMIFIRDVVEDDTQGKQYDIKVRDIDGVLHFYGTAKHIYVLQAVGDKKSNPSIRRFLESFTLKGKSIAGGMLNPSGGAQTSQPNSTASLSRSQPLDPDNVFASKEVTRKALVVARPEPRYTEPARKGNISGKIVIRAVLSSSGKVDRINVVTGIQGLTEQAVEAIRNIKFIPAVKDGMFVSQYITFEYHFRLY